MKKSILVLALIFVMMFVVAAVSAQEAEVPAENPEVPAESPEAPAEPAEAPAEEPAGFTVTYLENDCLAEVPTDEKSYAAGEEVTVLFEPVQYKDYMIFFGWDIDDDGIADFGYNFDTFEMPDKDVELKAICLGAGGGSTCKGCHMHGRPAGPGIRVFWP